MRTMNDKLLHGGKYEYQDKDNNTRTMSLVDVFDHGQWVDQRQIAILDSAEAAIKYEEYLLQSALAAAANLGWKARNVYLTCHPMTQTEFDNLVVRAGSSDGRLKHYYQGMGCYFQTAVQQNVLGIWLSSSINPPGWDSLASDDFKFSTHDVIESSVDAFIAGGYSYDPEDTYDSLTNYTPYPNLGKYNWAGLFTIPICKFYGDYASYPPDLFANNLMSPTGPYQNYGWCWCTIYRGKDEKHFEDVVDISKTKYMCEETLHGGDSTGPPCKRQLVDPSLAPEERAEIQKRCS
ncbi:hypothetical protein BKA65DRAFT_202902 [Rhexocercosporidium sp. MPI-PUGE-AT-0058]|nr:hypothetical protein BKA65DRAFT_202902 [Rhexocercosporidium sp. MPI-PUGE-AT-0058]